MIEIKKVDPVSYSITQMYDLVCALEKYPEFLPWIKCVRVLTRTPKKINASIEGTKFGVSFVVNIVYILHSNTMIEVRIPSGGPFRQIDGLWRFGQANMGSNFSFALSIEFLNIWVRWALSSFIKKEIAALLKAFNVQATKIYP